MLKKFRGHKILKLFLVDQGSLRQISKPVFSKGDVYVVDDDRTIYVWIGGKASVDEKTAGAAQARTLDQQRGGAAKIITQKIKNGNPIFLAPYFTILRSII